VSKVSRKGAKFIAAWEGGCGPTKCCAYRDPVGVLTIGHGTTHATGRSFGPSTCISRRKARRWLREDVNKLYLPFIPRRRIMKQQEIDALSSFAYNLGKGAVSDPQYSTLARRLLSQEGGSFDKRKEIYRQEFPKWVNAGGVPLPGLVKRRAAEVRMACQGDYSGRP
jgi:lysozyme